MINSQELIFMVDENNNPVSPLAREIAHGQGLWHRSCDIWVVNSAGEILCQMRSMKKDVKPGLWESYFGGHVLAGEDYLDSAVKEMYEELGVEIDPEQLKFFKIFKSDEENGRGDPHRQFKYIFRLQNDSNAGDFAYEQDEIDDLKWMEHAVLRRIIVDEKDAGWSLPGYAADALEWLKQ